MNMNEAKVRHNNISYHLSARNYYEIQVYVCRYEEQNENEKKLKIKNGSENKIWKEKKIEKIHKTKRKHF